jgi:predicted metal-binding protein
MNDIERAIEDFEAVRTINFSEKTREGAIKHIDIAIAAIEKQVQKKPIESEEGWICPTCKGGFLYSPIINPNKHASCNYCNECGQKLDWSEVENE